MESSGELIAIEDRSVMIFFFEHYRQPYSKLIGITVHRSPYTRFLYKVVRYTSQAYSLHTYRAIIIIIIRNSPLRLPPK
jgi:CRISPR/Cas system-associated endonuclease Cas1